MYYVRKLSKPSSLFKLRDTDNFRNIQADFLGQDLRTSSNTLSVWRSESLDKKDIDKAINAALLASSQVNASQFLIIDSDALEWAGIRTDDTEPGITAYSGLEGLHTNLCDLTYEKIGNLLQVYCKVCEDSQRTPKIDKERFKQIIIMANNENCLNVGVLQEHMQKEIQKVLNSAE
ncbi:hypothetical protein WMO24_14225 [Ruthenibacterium sp. CLA-JM-H11]|uniref:Uncharacterized protein n=1 Tax=Ruthenibacterium intestinale TaxID=3133163 RepID=A0ABV1GI94_9FIRM